MTTPMRNRMRRSTRPADYVSKARHAEAMAAGRPGGCTFSFNGDFPDAYDPQPVEASSRRRSYTVSSQTGGYHAVRRDDARRMPAINQHGVHGMTALAMLVAMVVVLGGILLGQMGLRSDMLNEIERKNARAQTLSTECIRVKTAIAAQSNDMNIRKQAVLLGLISSRGVDVEYLSAPTDAVITLSDNTVISSLASIWGQ